MNTLIAILAFSTVAGQDLTKELDRNALKGSPKVYVIVVASAPAIEDRIRTKAELELRKSRIPIGSFTDRGVFHLQLSLAPSPAPGWTVLFTTGMEAMKNPRDASALIYASTWRTGLSGMQQIRSDESSIMAAVAKSLDEFCNDYLAANPK